MTSAGRQAQRPGSGHCESARFVAKRGGAPWMRRGSALCTALCFGAETASFCSTIAPMVSTSMARLSLLQVRNNLNILVGLKGSQQPQSTQELST